MKSKWFQLQGSQGPSEDELDEDEEDELDELEPPPPEGPTDGPPDPSEPCEMEVEALSDDDDEIDPESLEEESDGPPDDPLGGASEDPFEPDVEKLWLRELSERESKAEPNVAMMKLNSGLSRSTA